MTQRYYFDTSIWRDYYENREDNFRPLGEWAFRLIQKIIETRDIILYSDTLPKELSIDFSFNEIGKILEIATSKGALQKASISENQKKEAAILSKNRGVSYCDALHAVLARDYEAILVARDNHFLQLTDITIAKKPEELI